MKSFYIAIILCIFGYISNLEEDQSFLYDIQYSSECEVNMKDFSEGYIPKSTKLFFRLKITPSDNMAITLKTLISDSYPFNSLYAYEFSENQEIKKQKKDMEIHNGYIFINKVNLEIMNQVFFHLKNFGVGMKIQIMLLYI